MRKWIKDIIKNGRTFRLIFIQDCVIEGLWYCSGEEIYRRKKNIFDFTWKNQVFEFYTDGNDIVEKALCKIDNIFKEEEIQLNTIKALDNFVEKGVENDR